MSRLLGRAFLSWLPIAVAATCLGALGYLAVQQVYRNDANDPQLQMAHDGATAIAQGASPGSVVTAYEAAVGAGGKGERGVVVLDTTAGALGGSLAPFVIVYDAAGTPTASSAQLGGTTPVIPKGVLDAAKATGENRVTWQPTSGVRIAAVAVPVGKSGQVVVSGRSLRAVEQRVDDLTHIAFVGWLGTLFLVLVAAILAERLRGEDVRA